VAASAVWPVAVPRQWLAALCPAVGTLVARCAKVWGVAVSRSESQSAHQLSAVLACVGSLCGQPPLSLHCPPHGLPYLLGHYCEQAGRGTFEIPPEAGRDNVLLYPRLTKFGSERVTGPAAAALLSTEP
jgi:hypothetical protein